MSSYIAEILGAKQPEFSHRIAELEKLSGNRGSDIRIKLRLRHASPRFIKKLGLEANDYSSRELYQALKIQLEKDNSRIANMLGVDEQTKPHDLSEKTIKFISKKVKLSEVWQLRSSFVKKSLQRCPPKMFMKAAGYRSVDSLLKRDNLAEILAIGRILDPRWYDKLCESFKKAQPGDLEQKSINFQVLSQARLKRIADQFELPHGQVSTVTEVGAVVIFPSKQRYKADVIANVAVLIEANRELKLASSLLKLLTVRKDFGKLACRLFRHGSKYGDTILPVRWSSVCHFAYKNRLLPEFTQPHISQEDLDVMPAVTEFCIAFPELNYWYGAEALGAGDQSEFVSFNLVDTVLNTANNLPFERRSLAFMRSSLWDELHSEYLRHPSTQKALFRFKDV